MSHFIWIVVIAIILKICHFGYRRTNSAGYGIGLLIGIVAVAFLCKYIYSYYTAALGMGN